MLLNFLNIDVPVVAAVNGPARRHPELPLLANVVLASHDAIFQDPAHFRGGMVPGDGVHVVFPYLMGATRASYFLFMAQEISAEEARQIGLVNEVVASDALLPRAWEIARLLLQQPARVRRLSRQLLSQEIKSRMIAHLAHGFALEAYAQIARD
jgi:enoyl-CoA hydratase/carnithine racemase